MKNPKFLLLLILFLPWITVPFLGMKAAKRFLPTSIFMGIVITFESVIAKKRKWWIFHEKISDKITGEFPLTLGPFFVGSLWVLKLTYGHFRKYLITNILIDTFFIYSFVNFLEKMRIGSMVRLKKYQFSLLFFIKSLILYGVQIMVDKLRNEI